MILVTLGTQDKSFKRLLEAIDKQISLGNINDEIIQLYTDRRTKSI